MDHQHTAYERWVERIEKTAEEEDPRFQVIPGDLHVLSLEDNVDVCLSGPEGFFRDEVVPACRLGSPGHNRRPRGCCRQAGTSNRTRL